MARGEEFFFIEWLRNPYTGEVVRISADTEAALIRLCFTQYKYWEEDDYYWGVPSRRRTKNKYYIRENIDVWDFNTGKKGAWLSIDNPENDLLLGIRGWLPFIYYFEQKELAAPGLLRRVSKLLSYPKDNNKHFKSELADSIHKSLRHRKHLKKKKRTDTLTAIEQRQERLKNGQMRDTELKRELENYFFWVLTKDYENRDIYDQLHYIPTVDLNYRPASRKLIINMQMPTVKQVRSVKFFQLEEATGCPVSPKGVKADCKRFYNHLIFELTLRIIVLLYASDAYQLIDTLVFNGYRMFIDRSTGRLTRDCIISLSFPKNEYKQLILRNADAEAVIRRVDSSVPTDFFGEPMKVIPS